MKEKIKKKLYRCGLVLATIIVVVISVVIYYVGYDLIRVCTPNLREVMLVWIAGVQFEPQTEAQKYRWPSPNETDEYGRQKEATLEEIVALTGFRGDFTGDQRQDWRDFKKYMGLVGKCRGQEYFDDEVDYNGDGCITEADVELWCNR